MARIPGKLRKGKWNPLNRRKKERRRGKEGHYEVGRSGGRIVTVFRYPNKEGASWKNEKRSGADRRKK